MMMLEMLVMGGWAEVGKGGERKGTNRDRDELLKTPVVLLEVEVVTQMPAKDPFW